MVSVFHHNWREQNACFLLESTKYWYGLKLRACSLNSVLQLRASSASFSLNDKQSEATLLLGVNSIYSNLYLGRRHHLGVISPKDIIRRTKEQDTNTRQAEKLKGLKLALLWEGNKSTRRICPKPVTNRIGGNLGEVVLAMLDRVVNC